MKLVIGFILLIGVVTAIGIGMRANEGKDTWGQATEELEGLGLGVVVALGVAVWLMWPA